jgi:hypothetical protein
MPTSHDVRRLLQEAGQAQTLADQQTLVAEATRAQQQLRAQAQAERDIDLANTAIGERFTPVPTHSRITAASDWLGEIETAADTSTLANQITAEATLWYGRTSAEVKSDGGEFAEQARGHAIVISGSFGDGAQQVHDSFLEEINHLRNRDLKTGALKEAASTLPQVGEQGMPADTFSNGNYDAALPLEATTSERAPQIQELEANNGPGASQDVVPVNDPALGHVDPSADQANGDTGTQQNGSTMTTNQRSASRHTAVSGLDQVQQTVSPDDSHAAPTPLPQEVAFPWVTSPQNVNQVIAETEQQLAERDQRKGASRQALAAARQVYANAMKQAGYDDSGWAGDMGAGGYQPDSPPAGAPGHNLGEPDPVYGYGGDQPSQPEKPYGAAEAQNVTNNPGMNYQPGQPTQYDMGGRQMATGSKHEQDPEIQRAQKFIAQRVAFLENRNH